MKKTDNNYNANHKAGRVFFFLSLNLIEKLVNISQRPYFSTDFTRVDNYGNTFVVGGDTFRFTRTFVSSDSNIGRWWFIAIVFPYL